MVDLTPPQVNSFGYILLPGEDGLVRFWINASDPFGRLTEALLTISINETSKISKSASTSASMSGVLLLERKMVFNGTHYYHDENLGFQTRFSYTVIVVDGVGLQSNPKGAMEQIVGDGAPPRILNAEITNQRDGKLTILAEVDEKGTGVESLEVEYSVNGGETWEQAPMEEVNNTHYVAVMEVGAESSILWSIVTKDLEGNMNEKAWNVWEKTPYQLQPGFPRSYIVGLLAATAIAAIIAIKIFLQKRREWALEARKQVVIEYIKDITNFLDLMVITPSGIPYYTFSDMSSEQGQTSTMYSSLLMALKSFSAEVLYDTNVLTSENHFKFGGTEIILFDYLEVTTAYIFSAQMQHGVWRKISQKTLEQAKELAISIEHTNQVAIRGFMMQHRLGSQPKILEVLIEDMSLDFILPHRIIDLNSYRKVGLPEENTIIQTIEQMSLVEGLINVIHVLERLETSEISTDDILFVFYQLREEGAIAPVSRRDRGGERQTPEEPEGMERAVEAHEAEEDLEEPPQEPESISLDSKEIRELLKQLHSRMTPSEGDV